jgi:two-component system response regulator FixJ
VSRGRVVVIDDDAGVLASLDAMLSVAGFEVTTYRAAKTFLDEVVDAEFACIVTDVRMPEISGLVLIDRLKRLGRGHWPLVVISGHADVPMAVAAMQAGACNFLEKPFQPQALTQAIEAAVAARGQGGASPPPTDDVQRLYETLSAREREVMGHLVNGASSKVAALVLGISPRTVDVFRANILRKMQAPNIAALATLVARRPI